MSDDNKPTLYTLMMQHGVGLTELVNASGVSSFLTWEMINGHTVTLRDAERILRGFNKLQNTRYTLNDIWCPAVEGKDTTMADDKPSLAALMMIHRVSPHLLARTSGVGSIVVEAMRRDKPVARKDAEKIIEAFNEAAKSTYSLDQIAVKLKEEQ